jgi:hypothetical protein
MKFTLAVLSLIILGGPALAQGVSNQRDMYGNLVRNGGTSSSGMINQSTPSNGVIRNAPIQQPINPISPPKSQQINRLGTGAN